MRTRTLIFSFFLFFFLSALFAVVTFPAALAWRLIEKEFSVPNGVRVERVSGKVWDGNVLADLALPAAGVKRKLLVKWRLSLRSLVEGKVSVVVHVQASGIQMASQVSAGLKGFELKVESALVDLARWNDVASPHRVMLSGEVTAQAMQLAWKGQQVVNASGKLNWTGGEITYPAGREQHTASFPAFQGRLFQSDQVVQIGIRDVGVDFDHILVTLSNQGWLQTDVKKRLLDLAGEPWRESVSEDQILFSIKRKLF